MSHEIYSMVFKVHVSNLVSTLLERLDQEMAYLYCNQIIHEFILQGPLSKKQIQIISEVIENDELSIKNQNGDVIFIYAKCQSNDISHLQISKGEVLKNRGMMISSYQIKNWQYYTVLVFGNKEAGILEEKLLQSQGAVIFSKELLSTFGVHSSSFQLKIDDIISNLTKLQLDVLKLAIEGEYYSIPRGSYLSDIAQKLGKARTTLEKIFRTAENRVMDEIIPYLYLFISKERE